MSDRKALSLRRVLEIAGHEFTQKGFGEVSVMEIATQARCSTSTIYEAYGNKEQLFAQAVGNMLLASWPQLIVSDAKPALWTLMAFTDTRMTSLARPANRAIFRTVITREKLLRATFGEVCLKQHEQVENINRIQVRAAIDDGTLRDIDIDVISYNLIANSAYEPMLHAMVYDTIVDVPALLRRTFLPFVTERGAAIMADYIRQRPTD